VCICGNVASLGEEKGLGRGLMKKQGQKLGRMRSLFETFRGRWKGHAEIHLLEVGSAGRGWGNCLCECLSAWGREMRVG
jgi:hypothetical protein